MKHPKWSNSQEQLVKDLKKKIFVKIQNATKEKILVGSYILMALKFYKKKIM